VLRRGVSRQIEHRLEYEEFTAALCLAGGRPPSFASNILVRHCTESPGVANQLKSMQLNEMSL